MLASLSATSDLTLRSYGTMDFWGAVDYGDGLTLDAGAFVQRSSGSLSFRTDAPVCAIPAAPSSPEMIRLRPACCHSMQKTITIDAGQSAQPKFTAL